MKKETKNDDLLLFKNNVYDPKINRFLQNDFETRVVFLNADFGWGKTRFVENYLNVEKNCIYSPWLNKTNNHLEEIYFKITGKKRWKYSVLCMIVLSIIAILSVFLDSLINLTGDNNYHCVISGCDLVCSGSESPLQLIIIGIIIVVLIIVVIFVCVKKPLPLIYFLKDEKSSNYEDLTIKEILKKVNNVLVIEDVDRCDDIENIMVVLNKISRYMISENYNKNKYILITGDYKRTMQKIDNLNNYSDSSFVITDSNLKGCSTVEKIASLKIDFSSIEDRMNSIFNQFGLSPKLSKIEVDEIVNFIKKYNLNVRFFIKFLKEYGKEIKAKNNMYYLFLKFFCEEKAVGFELISDNTMLDTFLKFPKCLNDIEMLLQNKKMIIMMDKPVIFSKTHEIKESDSYDVITNCFYKIINKDKEYFSYFKEFYSKNYYPLPQKYDAKISDDILYYYLISLISLPKTNYKRCYFPGTPQFNYDNYRPKSLRDSEIIYVEDEIHYIISYIACFLRNNRQEIKSNYPEIFKIIESYC